MRRVYVLTSLLLIVLSLIIAVIFCSNKYLFQEETERITISNNYLYIVRHRVPIDNINNYKDLFRLLFVDFIFFHNIKPTLEKFDIETGMLLETKKNDMIFHTGYIGEDYVLDLRTDPDRIKIFSPLDKMNLSTFDLKEKDCVLFDSATNTFYATIERDFLKLKGEKDFQKFEVPLKQKFKEIGIDSGLLILTTWKDERGDLKDFFVFNISKSSIKKIEIDGDWIVFDFKNLKLLAHKAGSGDYFIIELAENEQSFQTKKIQKLHEPIDSSFDEFIWDKKNNKIYFYDTGKAHFQDSFDLYQYDDSTFEQKTIHVELKR